MNDSNDNQQDVLVGSREPTKKNWLVAKVLLLFVASAVLIGGVWYAYKAYEDNKAKQAIEAMTAKNPDSVSYDYTEVETKKRIKQLEKQPRDKLSSDTERREYYEELNTLLYREGRCKDYEDNIDEMAKQGLPVGAGSYIDVAMCYRNVDETKVNINRVVDKAEKLVPAVKDQASREYFKEQVIYYRNL